ncbi:hypothetical protein [Kocuria rhizophila]|uniref:hypothetical protein n=1 Tax=Kocuria rhizophila TaxID=72000 RepID=UPI001EF74B88|nr:hypothetical protein [Kocuria rhizophila]
MSGFSTYGHGLEDTTYGETFETVDDLNAAIRDLDTFYNIPTGWHYYPDSGLEVTIFMPRKAKATTFRVDPCTPDDAAKLDRAALWLLVREHLAESQDDPGDES